MCRSRHLTGLQGVCQVFCFFNGEVTGDLAATACDLIINLRETVYIAVQYDSYTFTDVLTCQVLPFTGTLCVHSHRNLGINTHLREVSTSIRDNISFQTCTTISLCLQSNHLIVRTALIYRLNRPAETYILRQNGLRDTRLQHLIYLGGIRIVNISTYYRTTTCLTIFADRRVQQSKQRVVTFVLSNLSLLVSCSCSRIRIQVLYQVCQIITFRLNGLSLCFRSLFLYSLSLRSHGCELTVDLCQSRKNLG